MDGVVSLPSALQGALEAGHPWVYRDHVPPGFRAPTGAWVRARAGNAERWGLWDAEGAIALRLVRADRRPDGRWVAERMRHAWELREPLRRAGVTAYRWLNGEGDGVPGVVVDRYGEHAVLCSYGSAAATLVPSVLDAIAAVAPVRGVALRRPTEREERGVLWRGSGVRTLVVEEHGVRFHVDLERGQKSGLFLDQRENRAWLGPLGSGRSVLELFSYTGAFGVHLARGGAVRLVQVDRSREAIEQAQDNLRINGFGDLPREGVAADAMEWLAAARAERRRFDLVVCDPPSLARSHAQRSNAERAYERLHRAVLPLVARGGVAAFGSCTAQVTPEAFRDTIARAARKLGRSAQILHEAGHALDHPVLLEHPEGRYLKFVVLRVG